MWALPRYSANCHIGSTNHYSNTCVMGSDPTAPPPSLASTLGGLTGGGAGGGGMPSAWVKAQQSRNIWAFSLKVAKPFLFLYSSRLCVFILVTISDLAIFNFSFLLYDVASEVSPTWLTPVYLWFIQVAVTWLHLSLADWTTSPLLDDPLLVRCYDSVLGVYMCTFLLFYLGI